MTTPRKLVKTKDVPNDVPVILIAAADYIEKYGFARGMYQRSNGSCCGAGAIRAICGIPNLDAQDVEWDVLPESERSRRLTLNEIAARAVSQSGVTHPHHFIIGWSDGADKKTVVAGLQKAAEWAKAHPYSVTE